MPNFRNAGHGPRSWPKKNPDKMSAQEMRNELKDIRRSDDGSDQWTPDEIDQILELRFGGYDPRNSHDDEPFWRRYCLRHVTTAETYEVAP